MTGFETLTETASPLKSFCHLIEFSQLKGDVTFFKLITLL
jgi:hypothetical protein